jgi:hypothetical protein
VPPNEIPKSLARGLVGRAFLIAQTDSRLDIEVIEGIVEGTTTMAERLSGKSAIVSGSGSGIGRAAALIFAREGARVIVADVVEPVGRKARPEEIAKPSRGYARIAHRSLPAPLCRLTAE